MVKSREEGENTHYNIKGKSKVSREELSMHKPSSLSIYIHIGKRKKCPVFISMIMIIVAEYVAVPFITAVGRQST